MQRRDQRFLTVVAFLSILLSACSFGQNATPPPTTVASTTTQPPLPEVPRIALHAYARIGTPCPAVDWAVLAGIGKVESDHGRIFGGMLGADGAVSPIVLGPPLDGTGVGGNVTPFPAGEWAGQYGIEGEWLRAVGPMQFLPQTFIDHGTDGNGDGVLDPHNLFDAVATAATLLCSIQLPEGSDPNDIILSYNQSVEYQENVLTWAGRYRDGHLEFAR